MKVIEHIKKDVELGTKNYWLYTRVERERFKALIEYYEAAEGEFHYLGTSGDTPMYRRLKAARTKLEAQDG